MARRQREKEWRLYVDERTQEGKKVIELLARRGEPFIIIPTSESVPTLVRGAGYFVGLTEIETRLQPATGV